MANDLIGHAFLISILAVCFSCANKPGDNSLTIEAYRELGVPDPDKEWTMADYSKAHNILGKLKWERQLQLPVKDSKKSGSLFTRMISRDYLSFLQDSSISLNEKARRIVEFGVVYDYWMDIYSVPTVEKGYYDREIMEIKLFNLNLSEAAFKLANEINQSDDPADVALQYGYPSIKRAYLECLNKYLQPKDYVPAGDYWQEFSDQDMKRMIDSVHMSVVRNKSQLLGNEIEELRQSVNSLSDSTSSDAIRKKYRYLEKELSS